jgi:hypothetical protein
MAAPIRAAARATPAWDRFRERFGRDLEADFSQSGHLAAIRGKPGRSTPAHGFHSDDPQAAIARAREILDGLSDLLGLSPDWPLGAPLAKTGNVSAQVYFQESREGVALEPFGAISVDLDSQGGLIGVQSSYVPELSVVNSPDHSSSDPELRARALAAVPGDSQASVDGGDLVLWLSRKGGVPEAHYAFQYYVRGRQVIVDASDGSILYKRDRRQF